MYNRDKTVKRFSYYLLHCRLTDMDVVNISQTKELLHEEHHLLVFFYEWEHRTGTMCPFSSLHPLRKGKEM